MYSSIKRLLAFIVDYAGLFPPAAVTMQDAVENYSRYRSGPSAWMLGRFLLPATQLKEFETALLQHLASDQQSFPSAVSPWSINLIFPRPFDFSSFPEVLGKLWETTSKKTCQYQIKALELPPLSLELLKQAIAVIPNTIEVFCEIPFDADSKPYLSVLRENNRFAKIRTGGLTPASFPDSDPLALFLIAATQWQVPFKATAGLHYLLPGTHAISESDRTSQAQMQGFLNLAIASAIAHSATPERLTAILKQSDLAKFHFNPESLTVQPQQLSDEPPYRLSLSDLENTRTQVFRSFGSCSFALPITQLKEAHLC